MDLLDRLHEEFTNEVGEEGAEAIMMNPCLEVIRYREKLAQGFTTHAFNMADFTLLVKDLTEKVGFMHSIFFYPETRLQVFYKDERTGKKSKIHLEGFRGASWFDYQIQLERFFPRNKKIIQIKIAYEIYEMVVVFLPRVFIQKKSRKYTCPLVTVDIKTGEATLGTDSFYPSMYNPIVEEDLF